MQYDEPTVRREDHRLYVRDYPGSEPAIILMHGFPDNLHLYDRVVPSPRRRSTSGDVRLPGLGTVRQAGGYAYTASNQTGDLDAVIGHLQLGSVVLVAHDASGPPVATERAGAALARAALAPTADSKRPSVVALQARFRPIMAGDDRRRSC